MRAASALKPDYTGRVMNPRAIKSPYWLLPIGLFVLQCVCTLRARNQIRAEELAESVRNVYWLEHRTIYDGASSNVGWYGLLLLAYRSLGFSLFSAKYVRLALHLVSLLCLADLLRRWMGVRHAWLPMIAVGLSPILLYFNTIQTSYATDLNYVPVCLLLMVSLRFKVRRVELLKAAAFGFVAMLAGMSYPTFVLYWPAAGLAYWFLARQERTRLDYRTTVAHILAILAGAATPLAVALAYLRDPWLLINDPVADAGLFRGGGGFQLEAAGIYHSALACLSDLFVTGGSYYFELTCPDFSGVLARIGLGVVLATAGYLALTGNRYRPVILPACLLLLLSLILPSLSRGFPGIRRCTGIVAAVYCLLAVAWDFYASTSFSRHWVRWLGLTGCALLPLHHLLAFPAMLRDVQKPSMFQYRAWFAVKQTPTESLDYLLEVTGSKKRPLVWSQGGNPMPVRYAEIFAALSGYRIWNRLPDPPVRAYDWNTGKLIKLSIELWKSYYFPH